MADAQTVIHELGQQVAQLMVDKAILAAELAEVRERLEACEMREAVESGEAVEVPVEVDP